MAAGAAVNLLLGVTLGVLAARLLGLEDYGRYATLVAMASLVAKVNDLGLPHAYSYFYRRSAGALPQLMRILAINFGWCCLSAVLILALIAHFSLPLPAVQAISGWTLASLGVLIAIETPLNIYTSMVLATGNYRFLAALTSAATMLQILLILLFAMIGSVSLQIFIGLAALAKLVITAAVTVFFVARARREVVAETSACEVLSYGLRTHWGILLKQLGSRFELLFVASALAPAQTGMFSLALSIRDAGLMSQGVYAAPLQNLIIDRNKSQAPGNDRAVIILSILLQMTLATALAICAAVLLPFLIPLLYGEEYRAAIMPALVLFASIVFIGAAGICWISFNAKGRPHLTSLTLTVTGVPTPFVLYFMAEIYGLYGAAFATLLMAVLTFAISYYGIARIQDYSISDVRAALRRVPVFIVDFVGGALKKLRMATLKDKG